MSANSSQIHKLDVKISQNDYPIILGRGVAKNLATYLMDSTNNRKVLIVADSFHLKGVLSGVVDDLEKSGFEVFLYLIDGGKVNKTFKEVLQIYGVLEENDFARDSTLIAVGGGVVGDLGGFVASTYLRGINLVHIPSTLMAMVDSSVGGKVAINFRNTINAIGGYYHPIFTLMDLDFISTLSDRDYYSGLAEVIKCGLIADKTLCDFLKENNQAIIQREESYLIECIVRALKIKIDHVDGDVFEQGKRLFLNFGHTLGHSIEVSTQSEEGEFYRHGEGVALGILTVNQIASKVTGLSTEECNYAAELLQMYKLPSAVHCSQVGVTKEILYERFIRNVKKDKKRKDNNIRLILLKSIGEVTVVKESDFRLIEEAFNDILD